MPRQDDLEQYEATEAQSLLHLFAAMRPPPAVQAPPDFRAKVLRQVEQRRAHRGVLGVLATAGQSLRDYHVRWLSPLWHPPLAGELVTAADTSAQEQVFSLDDGEIRVTCEWRAAYQDQPAMLRITWQAHITLPGDFWVRFTRLDDPTAVLAEVRLGSALEGEEVFTAHALGFDPTQEPWALTLLLKEPHG